VYAGTSVLQLVFPGELALIWRRRRRRRSKVYSRLTG